MLDMEKDSLFKFHKEKIITLILMLLDQRKIKEDKLPKNNND